MSALVRVGLAIAVVPLLCVGAVVALAVAAMSPTTIGCAAPNGGNAGGSWDADQSTNAVIIVRVGAQLRVPRRGWVIAVATAIQESGLRNLGNLGDRNDHDSLGLFQQRPSQGWGTPAQLTDPVYAATAFYRALLRVPDWSTLPLTQAAQAVQRSAYPDAYARHERAAAALVDTATSRLGLPGCAHRLPAGNDEISTRSAQTRTVHTGQTEGRGLVAAMGSHATGRTCTSRNTAVRRRQPTPPASPWRSRALTASTPTDLSINDQ
jgi:hypothetical protein